MAWREAPPGLFNADCSANLQDLVSQQQRPRGAVATSGVQLVGVQGESGHVPGPGSCCACPGGVPLCTSHGTNKNRASNLFTYSCNGSCLKQMPLETLGVPAGNCFHAIAGGTGDLAADG